MIHLHEDQEKAKQMVTEEWLGLRMHILAGKRQKATFWGTENVLDLSGSYMGKHKC